MEKLIIGKLHCIQADGWKTVAKMLLTGPLVILALTCVIGQWVLQARSCLGQAVAQEGEIVGQSSWEGGSLLRKGLLLNGAHVCSYCTIHTPWSFYATHWHFLSFANSGIGGIFLLEYIGEEHIQYMHAPRMHQLQYFFRKIQRVIKCHEVFSTHILDILKSIVNGRKF